MYNGYVPPVAPNGVGTGNNYMTNGWGGATQQQMTAHKIDAQAEKVAFVVEMLQNALLGFDGIEKELVALSNAPVPPNPSQLVVLAQRVDTNQQQVMQGLNKIRELMTSIDRETDNIQKSGWGR